MKLIVTIPAYNEGANIAEVIKEIPRQIEGISQVEILVLDDGSNDQTVKQAKEAGARLAGWKCIFVPRAKLYHIYSATSSKYTPLKAFLVERNRLWLAIKNFPLSVLLLTSYFTFKRYLYQVYSVFVRTGSAGKFVSRFSGFRLIWILIRAWISAFVGFSKMLRKKRIIQKIKMFPIEKYVVGLRNTEYPLKS